MLPSPITQMLNGVLLQSMDLKMENEFCERNWEQQNTAQRTCEAKPAQTSNACFCMNREKMMTAILDRTSLPSIASILNVLWLLCHPPLHRPLGKLRKYRHQSLNHSLWLRRLTL
jgi:hypothetical protein